MSTATAVSTAISLARILASADRLHLLAGAQIGSHRHEAATDALNTIRAGVEELANKNGDTVRTIAELAQVITECQDLTPL